MKDMICVHRAATVGQADIVVAWLKSQGINAHVKDALAAGMFQTSLIVAPAGIEVCVLEPEEAERAKVLLRLHFEELEKATGADTSGQVIEATCEECGRSSSFPPDQRGRVGTCPYCREMIDIPERDRRGCNSTKPND